MKQTVKMYVIPIVVSIMIFVAAIFSYMYSTCKIFDPGLPKGYKIVCSTEGHKYSLYSDSFYGVSATVFDSVHSAKDFAWRWEKYKNKKIESESDKYKWEDCKDKDCENCD